MDTPKADEQQLIYLLSGDFSDSPTPYADLAAQLGWTEEKVLETIKRFQEAGFIRRLGATLWHQRSGFKANAMLVFEVEQPRVAECGELLASKPYVSHCYQRATAPGWPFNLYAMVHAENEGGLKEMTTEINALIKPLAWKILKSLKELKKSSLRYFEPQNKND